MVKVCILYAQHSYLYCCVLAFLFVFVFETGCCSKTHYVNQTDFKLRICPLPKPPKRENYRNKLPPLAGKVIYFKIKVLYGYRRLFILFTSKYSNVYESFLGFVIVLFSLTELKEC